MTDSSKANVTKTARRAQAENAAREDGNFSLSGNQIRKSPIDFRYLFEITTKFYAREVRWNSFTN